MSEISTHQQDTFDGSWLALREPVDAVARSKKLVAGLETWAGGKPHLNIVDLGAGAGSALRWLSPRLSASQSWTLLDGDATLLSSISRRSLRDDVYLQSKITNLATEDLTLALKGADIVSASALLDLVSEEWLSHLVQACSQNGCAAWLTLSVSGQEEWFPGDDLDSVVNGSFARDQGRDKGFGPALGAEAVSTATRLFEKAGWTVQTDESDWNLDGANGALLASFVAGFADGAAAAAPDLHDQISIWRGIRQRQLASGELKVRVGHLDLVAVPR